LLYLLFSAVLQIPTTSVGAAIEAIIPVLPFRGLRVRLGHTIFRRNGGGTGQ
jgi:hypothetical protein